MKSNQSSAEMKSENRILGMERPYWGVLLLTIVSFAVLIASSAFPPITDLPQHLAQIRLLEELLGLQDTVFDRGNYRINWLAPNTLVYLPLWLVEAAFDSFTAGRVAMFLLAASWALAIVYLVHRRNLSPVQAVFACVFILNLSFYWGFINFLFAFPLFVAWVLYATPERVKAFGRKDFGFGLLLLIALLGAHSLWFLLAVIWLVLVIGLTHKQQALSPAKLLYAFSPAIIPLAYSAYWFPGLRESLAEAGYRVAPIWSTFPWDRLSVRTFPDHLLGGLAGPIESTIVLLTLLWLVLCVYSNWDNLRDKVNKELAGCAVILWAVFLFAPDFFTNTMLFSQRWAAPAMIFTLLALPAPKGSNLMNAIPVVIFSAFVLASTLTWKAYDDTELPGLKRSLEQVPGSSRVMWLSYEQSPRFKNPPFLQVGALSQAISGSEINFSFAELGTGLVILDGPRHASWTRNLEWQPHHVQMGDFNHFDYVLVNGGEKIHDTFSTQTGMSPQKSGGRFKIYETAAASQSKPAIGHEPGTGVKLRKIVSGLMIPWGMTFVSEREVLVTERPGKIKRINLDSGEKTDIAGAPEVMVGDQAGLFDIATSPHYDEDGWIYLTYAKKIGAKAATALARARLKDETLTEFEELFVSNHVSAKPRQFGARIAFDNKGHIFIGHGDRSHPDSVQDLKDHSGSILRLNLDGSIPADNPFVGNPDAMPEIWSYGHRNPQGLTYDPETDRLWANEHGPRGGDEINLIKSGQNYGWPVISYGMKYNKPGPAGREGTHKKGLEQPIKYYVPSIAPSSLLYYKGTYYPGWNGTLLSGALAGTHLNQVTLDENGVGINERRYFKAEFQRIRNVIKGPDERVYVTSDAGNVYVLELE